MTLRGPALFMQTLILRYHWLFFKLIQVYLKIHIISLTKQFLPHIFTELRESKASPSFFQVQMAYFVYVVLSQDYRLLIGSYRTVFLS